MSNKLEELLDIQKKIESDKIAKAKIQGKIESLREKLLEAFEGCDSVKAIKKELIQKQKEIKTKEKTLIEKTESVTSEFNQLNNS